MKSKLELECELLMVENDIKFNQNNESALAFRATLCIDQVEKEQNLFAARYYANRKVDAQKEAGNLRVAIGACE